MYIGVDVGGTNIAIGIVTRDGRILDKKTIATETILGSDIIIENISMAILELLDLNNIKIEDVKSIGLGIPGLINSDGVILECVNLRWKNVDIKGILENKLAVRVFVQNDATVAAIAEMSIGSLKDENTAALLTLGTGVGGGLIINGRVYFGRNGIASEIGHMVVGENFYDCNCGRNGCLETYSSATGVIKYAVKLIKERDSSALESMLYKDFKEDVSRLTCKDVFDYSKEGDILAKKIVDRMVKYLVKAIVNLIITIEVEKIAIGGGVAAAGMYLLKLIEEELENERIFKQIDPPKLVLANMGNDAGIIGAALIEVSI